MAAARAAVSGALRAVLVDAAGTLLEPARPVAAVYREAAARHGAPDVSEADILAGYRRAYSRPYGKSRIRYVGDGREFWRGVVAEAVQSDDEKLFEDLFGYYGRPEAWKLLDGSAAAIQGLREAGYKTCIVSNFDTRLRPLLQGMGVDTLFDAIVVSAEVGAEKPNPVIFEKAFQLLDVEPAAAVHIGDDRRNDLFGARDAGCHALLMGADLTAWDDALDEVRALDATLSG